MLTPTNTMGDASTAAYFRERSAALSAAAAPMCPLCNCPDTVPAFRDNGCQLRACRDCDLFFVDPYPTSSRQHSEVAAGESAAIELLNCRRRYEGERLYYERHFSLIAEECALASSILDVGCGTGHLLERLAGLPNTCLLGIELNPNAARFARRTAQCEILEIPFEQFRGARRFDAITLINVFSHIPSFDGLFHSLRAALAPNGKIVIRTSEMAASVSRWNQAHWGIPDDLHFLGLRTLDRLCARYGFRVTRHVRQPFEEELFHPSRWRQMGRNPWLNTVKRAAVLAPGALPALKTAYSAALGQRLFVSFIVLEVTRGESELRARGSS